MPRAGSGLGFWAYVIKGPGCWRWVGGTVPVGYGMFSIAGTRTTGSLLSQLSVRPCPVPTTHRWFKPTGTPMSVRPDHMTLATNRENFLRGHHPNAVIHRQREAA